MPLDPDAQAFITQVNEAGRPPMNTLTPAEARAGMVALTAMTGVRVEVGAVAELSIPGPDGPIPGRWYRPEGGGPFPVLVWFHGGGWVLGDLETADNTCRQLAAKAGVVVVSVDYRLAPEHPWPAAPDDCYAATAWVAEHAVELDGEPTRVAVGGDSAGGNLAAVVARLAGRRGTPSLRHQLLVYPVADARMGQPSFTANAEGYLLTADSMRWFYDQYVAGADAGDPTISPLLAADEDLVGLAPALVITAEFDPLRDEGEAYGLRLEHAGVPVKISRYDGQIHGFFGMPKIMAASRRALDEATDALRPLSD